MTYSSSLAGDLTPLVLDTSVLINLHASRSGDRILEALPNDVLVPEIVAAELERETAKTKGKQQFFRNLVARCNVGLIALNDCEYQVFGSLVSGSPSLGDGEAATIAIAVVRRHRPIIDERQGRLRVNADFSVESPGWSLDIFRHPRVVAALGAIDAANALYLALRDGRMRIHENHCDHVVSIIGLQRALECNSLPRYKVRRDHWRMMIDARARCRPSESEASQLFRK